MSYSSASVLSGNCSQKSFDNDMMLVDAVYILIAELLETRMAGGCSSARPLNPLFLSSAYEACPDHFHQGLLPEEVVERHNQLLSSIEGRRLSLEGRDLSTASAASQRRDSLNPVGILGGRRRKRCCFAPVHSDRIQRRTTSLEMMRATESGI